VFRSALDAPRMVGEPRRRGVAPPPLDLGGEVGADGLPKLFPTVAAAFAAAAARDRVRERVARVRRDRRRRGRYLGGRVPFGFRVGEDGGPVEVPEQRAAIPTMVEPCRRSPMRSSGASAPGGRIRSPRPSVVAAPQRQASTSRSPGRSHRTVKPSLAMA
jgi:hypothetical protein